MAKFRRTLSQPDDPPISRVEIEQAKAEAQEEERRLAIKHAQQAAEDAAKAKEREEKEAADRKKAADDREAAEAKQREATARYTASLEQNSEREPLLLKGDVFNGVDTVVVNGVVFKPRA